MLWNQKQLKNNKNLVWNRQKNQVQKSISWTRDFKNQVQIDKWEETPLMLKFNTFTVYVVHWWWWQAVHKMPKVLDLWGWKACLTGRVPTLTRPPNLSALLYNFRAHFSRFGKCLLTFAMVSYGHLSSALLPNPSCFCQNKEEATQ